MNKRAPVCVGSVAEGEQKMQPSVEIGPLSGPLLVTVAYLGFWYYLLVGLQRKTKYRLFKEYTADGRQFDRYFGQDPQMLAADRAVINTQEQMVPFLTAFWMYALFVSPRVATVLGMAYIALRFFYPRLLGKALFRMQPRRVYFVTVPSYALIFYMLGATVWQVIGSS
ncbi:MAPEG family protein [Immundisolibacter sp.]|uniref:MAPEG family protein n=1 Tax=Immundisolibacter sp. TaxID=1934948 RepID=UPI0035656C4B